MNISGIDCAMYKVQSNLLYCSRCPRGLSCLGWMILCFPKHQTSLDISSYFCPIEHILPAFIISKPWYSQDDPNHGGSLLVHPLPMMADQEMCQHIER